MKIAVYSDTHSNLEALTAVFADMESQNVRHRICLGDVVGYGGSPHESLELTRKHSLYILLGNHDEACSSAPGIDYIGHVKAGIEHSRKNLSPEEKDFLKDLPRKLTWENLTLTHSSLFQPERWHYLNTPLNIEVNFQYQKKQICFCGHTHIPVFLEKVILTSSQKAQGKHSITSEKRYLINCGSVGQPRDGDPRASYVIYDLDDQTIEFRRIEYDIPVAQKKIREAGLPDILADRLAKGS
jgi:predicted phosphodiesterase